MDLYMATALEGLVVGRVKADGNSPTGPLGLSAGSAAVVTVQASDAHFFEPGEAGMSLSENVIAREQAYVH
jgi:hypothetical protein